MKRWLKIIVDMKGHYKSLIYGWTALIIMTVAQLYTPLITRDLLNLIQDKDPNLIMESVKLGLFLLAIFGIITLAQYIRTYFVHDAAFGFIHNIRTRLYDHIQYLSMSFFADKQTGQLMSRISSDAINIEAFVAHAIPDLITNAILFVGSMCILFTINKTLTLCTLLSLPPTIFTVWFYSKKVRPLFKKTLVSLGEFNGVLQDNLAGMKEIQIFNKQETESKKVEEYSKNHVHYVMAAMKQSAFFHPFISFVNNIGNVIVIIVGGILAFYGKVSSADIVTFMMFLSFFYQPVLALGRTFEDIQSSLAAADRIYEILEIKSEVKDKENAVDAGKFKGEIEFKNVTFGYNEGDVLKNVSVKINKGEKLAIVGATGVGKSTFVNLLTRFYDVDSGEITIDGKNITDITQKSLRENISMVLQDVFLFHGTVRENIAYGSVNATEEDIRHAAKIANAEEFINEMENGYDTFIGERGVRLSGGQKQRISIARAILRDKPILILDEATASIDTNTERKIQKALDKAVENRTTIIIAHRMTTVENADKIMVLDKDGVAEFGTHSELMSNNGIYKSLVEGE